MASAARAIHNPQSILSAAHKSVIQFPEIAAYFSSPTLANLSSLSRPIDVFNNMLLAQPSTATFKPSDIGSPLHLLLAALDVQSSASLQHGDWSGASSSLSKSLERQSRFSDSATDPAVLSLRLSTLLSSSYSSASSGSFSSAMSSANAAVSLSESSDDVPSLATSLHLRATSSLLSRLPSVLRRPPSPSSSRPLSAEDEDVVADLQMSARHADSLFGSVAAAASLGQLGTASLLLTGETNDAIEAWEEGLELLQEAAASGKGAPRPGERAGDDGRLKRVLLKADLHANVAAALLCSGGPGLPPSASDLKDASDAAGQSLKLLDGVPSSLLSPPSSLLQPRMPFARGGHDDAKARTLCLLARCYEHAGAAVTAEGLLQSALDASRAAAKKCGAPFPIVGVRQVGTLMMMEGLYSKWARRENDKFARRTEAGHALDKLGKGWREALAPAMEEDAEERRADRLLILGGLHLFDAGDWMVSKEDGSDNRSEFLNWK